MLNGKRIAVVMPAYNAEKTLERTVAEEEKALASPGSDDRRKALDFRVKTLKADIQAERDLIQSIQTGELIHTRT